MEWLEETVLEKKNNSRKVYFLEKKNSPRKFDSSQTSKSMIYQKRNCWKEMAPS